MSPGMPRKPSLPASQTAAPTMSITTAAIMMNLPAEIMFITMMRSQRMPRQAITTMLVRQLDSLSEDMLGWTFPPPAKAIAEAKWMPDDPHAATYCLRCGDSVGPGEATEQGCGTCREGAELP